MISAKISINPNRIFDRKLISSSKRPILVLGYLEFIFALVYLPVKTTIPIIYPAAKTVLAHAVLSNPRAYLLSSPENDPIN